MSGLSYFRRRLAETQRWSDAPPIVRYQAASSTVDDDSLERTGENFGAPYGESGFGTSEVLQELLSKDPKYVPVSDLAQYQQGLIDTGYLPPSYQPTGQWDDMSAAADRRASRDAFNTSRSGGGFASASIQTLFRYLGYTVPTSVFEGMYGIAQGIVSDAARAVTNPVEVFEEGGLVGGAATGAGIGAAATAWLGPGAAAGAVVGGLIGGTAGFFADLFDDDDEGEEGLWQNIVGALSPIDEIRSGDAKNLFSALSTIMTASAILKGAQVAKAGVSAAGGMGSLATRDAWRMAARDQVAPGLLNQITQAGLKHRVMGGAMVGGVGNLGLNIMQGDTDSLMGDFFTGAAFGAVGGKVLPQGAATKAISVLDNAPLARIAGAPAGKITQAIYTGAAAPTIVARGLSELSGGETEVGSDIRNAPKAPTPIAVIGDGVFGSLIFPSRLLPWKGADIAKGVSSLSSNHALLPFANFARTRGTKVTQSMQQAMDEMRTKLGRDPKTGEFDPVLLAGRVHDTHIQHGIELTIAPRVAQRVAQLPPPRTAYDRAKRFQLEEKIAMEERSKLKAQILKEAEESAKSGDIISTPTGQEMAMLGASDDVKLQNFLAERGYDPDFLEQHYLATEHLNRRRTALLEEGRRTVDPDAPVLLQERPDFHFVPAVKDEFLVAQDFERFGGKIVTIDPSTGEEFFHGTSRAFDAFDTLASKNRYGRDGVDKFYFTESEDVARRFSRVGGHRVVDPRRFIESSDLDDIRSVLPDVKKELDKAVGRGERLEYLDDAGNWTTVRKADDIPDDAWEQAIDGAEVIAIWKKGRSPNVRKEKVYGKTLDLRSSGTGPRRTIGNIPDDMPEALRKKVERADWSWFEYHSKELIDWARSKGYGKVRIDDAYESGGESVIALPEFIGKHSYTQVGEYESAAQRYVDARRLLDDAPKDVPTEQLERAVTDAGKKLDEVLLEMRNKRLIDRDIYDTLRPGVGTPKVETKLINYLQDAARTRPRRDDALTDELAELGLDRYMAVKTGENMIDYTHFVDTANVAGITDRVRYNNFFEGLASLGARVDKADLGRLRYDSIVRHLDKTTGELLRDGDGKQAADDLYDFLKKRYDPEYAKREGVKMEVKLGSIIRREDAAGNVTRELFKVDPRDLNADDIVKALRLEERVKDGIDVYEAAERIKRSVHVGAAFGADIAHPLTTARSLFAGLRINGLPGVNDFVRTINFVPAKWGAKNPGRFKKGSYGYLPQHLRRFHMALQFSLSPTFDASRYAEAAMFGKIRGGDIPLKANGIAPTKWVSSFEEGWVSPTTGQRISGEAAVREMNEFGDRVLYGRAANQNFDELQLRLLHRGVLGFKPREVEYAQAWWLAQKKAAKGPLGQKDLEEIRETVMQIGQYGTKQTAFGNSMHFIFFPFLFSRKQLTAMVDFTLGAPTRNLLIHEGVRRWYEVTGEDGTSMSEDFSRLIEKHLPVLQELGRINNLAYGVSPGRFFLDGIIDKPTEGKIAQGLTSVLAPGGVHSPIGDVAGQAVQLFMPQVWTEDSIREAGGMTGALGLIQRLVPLYRDVDRWFYDKDVYGTGSGIVGAQVSALSGRGTPRAQMNEYLDTKRVMSAALESLAQQQGFTSWASLRNQRPDVAGQIDEIENELAARFPEGYRLSQEFTNKAAIKEQALYDIATKPDRTEAEDAINIIGMVEAQAKALAAQTGRTQEEVLRAIAPIIRSYAGGLVGDRQFMDLWDGLFRNYYGPLRQIEVA